MNLSNRLGDALSPYLRQHAEQAIAWQPWDNDALMLARRLDRPILLSIGYSACHWCHIMADEAFSDDGITDQLNAHFLCIKVDREERPDLDRIYQLAHQLLTGQGGGWPLNVFLDPETQAPFFAGTYFPLEARSGLMAFGQLLERIEHIWSERRDELRAQHVQLQQALKAIAQARPTEEPVALEQLTDSIVAQASARFDSVHGGFGEAPKFPQAPLLAFLAQREDDEQAEQMLADTLTAITRHGLMDQLGGGFFRYSVDAAWEIPHFEKLLCDNALLLGLLAQAAQRWPRESFLRGCELTVGWLTRVMRLEGGGYAASLDADSEGAEGRHYLWQAGEFEQALDASDLELAKARYGLDGPANWEGKAWHLLLARNLDELIRPGQEREELRKQLDSIRRNLLAYRDKRVLPDRDDKLVAAWNGLAIEALARAGRLLGRSEWQQQAAEDLDAVAVRLFGQEPPRSVWREGRSAQVANIDDHASLLLACLELLRYRFESRWFNLARRLARRMERHFVDDDSAVTYFTSNEAETLLTRPLALADDATPSGAGLAILGMARLSALTGQADLHRVCRLMINAAAGDISRAPLAHATLVQAMHQLEQGPATVLLAGDEPITGEWQTRLARRPGVDVYRLPPGLVLEDPPERLAALSAIQRPQALICLSDRCLPACHDIEQIEQHLAGRG